MKIVDKLPDEVTAENSAIMAIDFQHAFCNPSYEDACGNRHTDYAATSMERVRPHFQKAGLQMIWVYMDDRPLIEGTELEVYLNDDDFEGDKFYAVHPCEMTDILLPKTSRSLFKGFYALQAKRVMSELQKSNLFICGVSLPECVLHTMCDAIPYVDNIYLVSDLSAQSSFGEDTLAHPIKSIIDMQLNDLFGTNDIQDVGIVHSRQILAHLRP